MLRVLFKAHQVTFPMPEFLEFLTNARTFVNGRAIRNTTLSGSLTFAKPPSRFVTREKFPQLLLHLCLLINPAVDCFMAYGPKFLLSTAQISCNLLRCPIVALQLLQHKRLKLKISIKDISPLSPCLSKGMRCIWPIFSRRSLVPTEFSV